MSLFNERFFESLFSQPFVQQPQIFTRPQVSWGVLDNGSLGRNTQPLSQTPRSESDGAVYGQPIFGQPVTNLSGLVRDTTHLPSREEEPNIAIPEIDSRTILLNESRPTIAIRDSVKDLRVMYRNMKTLTEVVTATMSWLDNDIAANVQRPATQMHNELQRLEKLITEARTKLGHKLYGESDNTSETTIDVDSVS
jgi:hypothetical protein